MIYLEDKAWGEHRIKTLSRDREQVRQQYEASLSSYRQEIGDRSPMFLRAQYRVLTDMIEMIKQDMRGAPASEGGR